MAADLSYVLISPARDEAQFIELTLKSVVAQQWRPAKWVIVSDGSTDGTDEIVARYAVQNPWIELVQLPARRERHFAGKVDAFNAGYARVRGLEYAAIGSLDADLSFDEDYFSFLLGKMANDSTLGLVGTPFQDIGKDVYDYRFVSIEHVSGACQLFRRECFEQIGGYIPLKGGGIDQVAVLSARMKGWKTRTFTEEVCHHHRPMGTAQHGTLKAKYNLGKKDYALGSHPLWQCFRTMYQMTKWPLIAGGLALGAGYASEAFRGSERRIPKEMVDFRHREQMQRLKNFLPRILSRDKTPPVPESLGVQGKR